VEKQFFALAKKEWNSSISKIVNVKENGKKAKQTKYFS
jgi:hypothetical protein